jgi:hypothetical protein
MDIDQHSHPYSTPHSPVEHLTCPPKALVECMFPDAFVFPASLLKEASMPSGSPSSMTPKPTVRALFDMLSNDGLYSQEKWTGMARAPDFHKQHHNKTEEDFKAFLETIVERTAELIGAKSEEVRTWSSSHDTTGMPGCFEIRKPDIVARRKEALPDWRTVDCVVELKNRTKSKDSESLGQLAERARTLFNVQDTRRYGYTLDSTYQSSMTTSVRFAILIRIRLDDFSYTAYDRGGSITSPFVNINTHALLFYRLILGVSFAERRHLGYDTSISGLGMHRRLKLDLGCEQQGLKDLAIQLVLHMTGKINGRGTTVRLLKVDSETLANFYGDDKQSQYKSLPGVKPGQKNFGIISKDSWEEVHNDSGELSEGILLQLLHAKGVLGVSWCLDEKPVLVPDAPAPPIPIDNHPLFIDNTLYIRSRWGIRMLQTTEYAMTTLFRQEVNANKAKIEDEMKTQFVSSPTFTSMLKKISRIIPRVKMIFPKAKQSEMAGSSSLPSSAMSSSDMGKKADKGKKKMDGEKKKTDKGKGKAKAGTPSSPSSPPATSPTAPGQTAAQPSHTPQVFIDEDKEKNRQFTVRCHVRSYLYPVGTPIYWFRSAIELVCVLKDLVESECVWLP